MNKKDRALAYNYLKYGSFGDSITNDYGYTVEVVEMCGGRYALNTEENAELYPDFGTLTDSIDIAMKWLEKGETA